MAGFAQIPIELLLSIGRVSRHNDLQLHVLIAAPTAPPIQTLASQPQPLPALSPGGNLHLSFAVDRGHLDRRAQHSFRGRDGELSSDVISRDGENGMRPDLQLYVQVTRLACSRLTVLAHFYHRALTRGRRYIHVNRLGAQDLTGASARRADDTGRSRTFSATSSTGPRSLKRNPVPASAVSVFERNLHLGFRVLPATGSAARGPASVLGLTRRLRSAKKCLEEFAETASAKNAAKVVELYVDASPSGRRCELSAILPVGTKLIVAFALLGIGEDLVRFVDPLELVFGYLVAGVHVGVILPGKLTIGLTDLSVGGVSLYA